MKVITNIKRNVRKGMLLGVLVAAILGAGVLITPDNQAAAGDCDANAVIHCGVGSTAEVNAKYDASASTRDIFNYFGIDGTEVNNLHTTAKTGSVTRGGLVKIGNDVVATNALTAGRQNIAGSTKVSFRGTTFYTRPPSVSFQQPELPAFVVLDANGNFKFAIIKACGNPVKATPKEQPKPDYTIEKKVSHYGKADYDKTIAVKSGEAVEYRIEVKSTGAAPVRDIKVKDILPPNVEIDGNVTRDGNVVSPAEFVGAGVKIPSLAPGQSTIFKFKARIGVRDTPGNCNPANLNNVARMDAPGLPAKDDNAAVNKTCVPTTPVCVPPNTGTYPNCVPPTTTPVCVPPNTGTYPNCVPPTTTPVCNSLSLQPGSDSPTNVVAKVTYAPATATVSSVSYNFGDGTPVLVTPETTVTHQYAARGRYAVTATITFVGANGPSVPCTAIATFAGSTPTYSCELFDLSANKTDRTVTATSFKTTASNGAVFTKATINWGDNSTATTTPDVIGQKHQYAADGSYNVIVTAHFAVPGQNSDGPTENTTTSRPIPSTTGGNNPPAPVEVVATSVACQKPVSFTTDSVCIPPATGTPPNCVTPPPPVVVTKAVQTPPATLVNTGAGSVAGLFATVVAIGAYAHRRIVSRQLSMNDDLS